jgi:hypothetical protein
MGPWWGRWRWAERGGGGVDAGDERVGLGQRWRAWRRQPISDVALVILLVVGAVVMFAVVVLLYIAGIGRLLVELLS